MLMYEGLVVKKQDGFIAVILRLDHDEPCCDTLKEFETKNEEEANIWVDDEMSRLTTGKGLWE